MHMMTSRADFFGYFGCGSTGMPRPLSVTDEIALGVEVDLDPGGEARHRLVHGVVDHLGEEVMQRLLVGAADVHARAAAHRLEAFEDLDIGGRVVVGGFRSLAGCLGLFAHALCQVREQVAYRLGHAVPRAAVWR